MNLDFPAFKNTNFFSNLNFIRFLSIIAVIWHHTGSELLGHQLPFLNSGNEGVQLFFLLSGFLITTLLLREQDKTGTISLFKFSMRRVVRIFPLYYLVLGIYCVLVSLFESSSPAGQTFWENLPYFLTYTSNLFVSLDSGRVIFYFAWSLATEEQFYLLWPILMKFMNRRRVFRYMLLLAATISLFSVIAPYYKLPYLFDFISKMPLSIILGVLVAMAMNSRIGFQLLKQIFIFKYSMPIYSILTILSLIQFPGILPFRYFSMMALLVNFILLDSGKLFNFVNSKLINQIGMISYGMYLFHMLCANVTKKIFAHFTLNPNAISYFLITTILTIIVSKVSFETFEKFFLGMKKKYSPYKRRASKRPNTESKMVTSLSV